jgi:hypothetical protein
MTTIFKRKRNDIDIGSIGIPGSYKKSGQFVMPAKAGIQKNSLNAA